MKTKQLKKVMKRNKGNPYMRRRDMRRLQKAINHNNRLLFRLGQLERDGVMNGHSVMTDWAKDIKRHLLWIADEKGVAVDPGGMPR